MIYYSKKLPIKLPVFWWKLDCDADSKLDDISVKYLPE